MEDRLQPKTAPQCTREPYTAGVLEAPAGYSGQAARTGRTAFMSGPVFGDRSSSAESGIGCGNNVHDPSPNWTSTPPDSITAADWGNAAGNEDRKSTRLNSSHTV